MVTSVADTSPASLAKQLIAVLAKDADRLDQIDSYERGDHAKPYMPQNADAEYRLLAKRAISNWCPLLVTTPAQSLYVDGFRPGGSRKNSSLNSPEWKHWQRSRLDARQLAVHRGAIKFGHSFVLTEKRKGKVASKGLSAMKTAALFEDPANDDDPYAVLTVTKMPTGSDDKKLTGRGRLWDGRREYQVAFDAVSDMPKVVLSKGVLHGAKECPVTRFAASVDLEGRTLGVIEPMMALQDRINQTVFDLLVAQTYGSFKVRTVTGMAPPLMMEPVYADPDDPNSEIVDYKPKLDSSGNPVPAPVRNSASRFLFAEDHEAKFGSLDETPLGGFIESIDMSIRHLSAISQTPPHYLLGQIANLSAEALDAAEIALQRKVQEFRASFGESWERVFRIAAELENEPGSADDYSGEVIWRDMENKSLAQSADALGKLGDQLGIPKRGLWPRVPGVTETELEKWDEMAEKDDASGTLADAVRRANAAGRQSQLGQTKAPPAPSPAQPAA